MADTTPHTLAAVSTRLLQARSRQASQPVCPNKRTMFY